MLAVTDRGAGPALVLLHGMGSDRHRWDPVVDLLAPSHRCVAVDLPGHGESPYDGQDAVATAAAVQQVVEELDLGPVTVVGHSFGAGTALLHAALHRPRSVVAVDPGGFSLRALSESLAPFADRLRGDGFAAAFREWEQRWGPDAVPGGLRFAPRQEAVLGYWSALLDPDEAARRQPLYDAALRAVAVPALVLLGTPPSEADQALLATMPTTTVERVAGGHYPHLHDPEGFCARLRRWLAAL